jgi:hypothetical protein
VAEFWRIQLRFGGAAGLVHAHTNQAKLTNRTKTPDPKLASRHGRGDADRNTVTFKQGTFPGQRKKPTGNRITATFGSPLAQRRFAHQEVASQWHQDIKNWSRCGRECTFPAFLIMHEQRGRIRHNRRFKNDFR